MIYLAASPEAAKMAANSVADMSMAPGFAPPAPNMYLLYGMAALGIIALLGSLWIFYRVGRISADNRAKMRRGFAVGILLFFIGSFLLSYFSYVAGQSQIRFPIVQPIHPGFDPRVT